MGDVAVVSGRTRRKTLTLPEELVAEIEEFTGERGFSAFAARSLAQSLALEKARQFVAEHEAEAGEITQDARDRLPAKETD